MLCRFWGSVTYRYTYLKIWLLSVNLICCVCVTAWGLGCVFFCMWFSLSLVSRYHGGEGELSWGQWVKAVFWCRSGAVWFRLLVWQGGCYLLYRCVSLFIVFWLIGWIVWLWCCDVSLFYNIIWVVCSFCFMVMPGTHVWFIASVLRWSLIFK